VKYTPGSLRRNFQRAIDRKQLLAAETLARQSEPPSIAYAFALCLLIAAGACRRIARNPTATGGKQYLYRDSGRHTLAAWHSDLESLVMPHSRLA
jgi:hypothetical protein